MTDRRSGPTVCAFVLVSAQAKLVYSQMASGTKTNKHQTLGVEAICVCGEVLQEAEMIRAPKCLQKSYCGGGRPSCQPPPGRAFPQSTNSDSSRLRNSWKRLVASWSSVLLQRALEKVSSCGVARNVPRKQGRTRQNLNPRWWAAPGPTKAPRTVAS